MKRTPIRGGGFRRGWWSWRRCVRLGGHPRISSRCYCVRCGDVCHREADEDDRCLRCHRKIFTARSLNKLYVAYDLALRKAYESTVSKWNPIGEKS